MSADFYQVNIGDLDQRVEVGHHATNVSAYITVMKDGKATTAKLEYPQIYALIAALQGANMRLKDGCK